MVDNERDVEGEVGIHTRLWKNQTSLRSVMPKINSRVASEWLRY